LAQDFHQLEAIAERVESMYAAKTVKGDVGLHDHALSFAGRQNLTQIVDYERRMGSFGGVEVGLDPKMQADGTCSEPDALAIGHGYGLFDLEKSEDAGVKSSRTIFTADRDGDLDMFDAEDGH
jgi:hypothetical protein